MKYFIIFLISMLTLISCKQEKQHHKSPQNGANPSERIRVGGKSQFEDIKFKPDTTIGKIKLLNSENVNAYLGKNIMVRLKGKDQPKASVITKNHQQRLVVTFHNADAKKEFSEFLVRYNNQTEEDTKTVEDTVFQTESGIKLGISRQELKAIKGKPVSQMNGKTTLLYYEISDFMNSEFLKKYNLPIYYANYKFKDDRLVSFSFGFDNP